MIPPTMTPTRAKAKPDVPISELRGIIDRENNTIRMWERKGILPERLHSHRGPRNVRHWTWEQVHGPQGIKAWMEENNMRPGNAIASAKNEGKHVAHLRRPKFISADLVNLVVMMKDDGKSSEEIIKTLYPRTKYVSEENFEMAMRRYLKRQGIDFPKTKATRRAAPKIKKS